MVKKFIFLSIVLIGILSSCSKEDNTPIDNNSIPSPIVTVFFSPNGLGDRGYNDNIAHGVNRSQETHGYRLNRICPTSLQEAERYMDAWLSALDNTTRRLLVLASEDYEAMVVRYADRIPDDDVNRVYLFESRSTDLPAYTFYLPFYGVCYQAGYLASLLPSMESAAVLCANNYARPIIDGRDAFAAGYNENCNYPLDYIYLSDSDEGYALADSTYRLSYTLHQLYDFVFPLAGGSVQGLLRYNREYPTSFYTAGVDVDISDYSTLVPYSAVKHIDKAVEQTINLWIEEIETPRQQRLDMEAGFTELVIAEHYRSLLEVAEKESRANAIIKEKAYEELQK